MEGVIEQLSIMGSYGLVGVMLALIALTATAVWMLFKMACNHISHTNDIFTKNSETLTKLIDAQDVNTEALNRLINKL